MSEMNGIQQPNFDTMTPAQFEEYLPEFFAAGSASVSSEPRLQKFLERNPDCAALVRDLETIAEYARSLFPVEEPSDEVWVNIKRELGTPGELSVDPDKE